MAQQRDRIENSYTDPETVGSGVADFGYSTFLLLPII